MEGLLRAYRTGHGLPRQIEKKGLNGNAWLGQPFFWKCLCSTIICVHNIKKIIGHLFCLICINVISNDSTRTVSTSSTKTLLRNTIVWIMSSSSKTIICTPNAFFDSKWLSHSFSELWILRMSPPALQAFAASMALAFLVASSASSNCLSLVRTSIL